MAPLIVSSRINEASKRLSDPLIQTKILLYSSYKTSFKTECSLESIVNSIAEHLNSHVGIVKIEAANIKGTVYLYDHGIAAAVAETSSTFYGRDALALLEDSQGTCTVTVFTLDLDLLDEETKNVFVQEVIEPVKEASSKKGPETREEGRILVSIKILDRIASSTFSEIYEAETYDGRRIIVKIPRYPEEVDAVVSEARFRLIQEAFNSMKLRYVNELLLMKGLKSRGYNELLAKSLVRYREHVAPVILVSGNFRSQR